MSLMAIDNEQISVLCSRYKQFLTQFELAWISTFTQSHCHFWTTWKHRQWNLTQCVKLRCTYMDRHTGISLHNNCTVQTYRNMLLFHYKHQIYILTFLCCCSLTRHNEQRITYTNVLTSRLHFFLENIWTIQLKTNYYNYWKHFIGNNLSLRTAILGHTLHPQHICSHSTINIHI